MMEMHDWTDMRGFDPLTPGVVTESPWEDGFLSKTDLHALLVERKQVLVTRARPYNDERHLKMDEGDILSVNISLEYPYKQHLDLIQFCTSMKRAGVPVDAGGHVATFICTHLGAGTKSDPDVYLYYDNWGCLAALMQFGLVAEIHKSEGEDETYQYAYVKTAHGGRCVLIKQGQRTSMCDDLPLKNDNPCWVFRNRFLMDGAPLTGLDVLRNATLVVKRALGDPSRNLHARTFDKLRARGYKPEQIEAHYRLQRGLYDDDQLMHTGGVVRSRYRHKITGPQWIHRKGACTRFNVDASEKDVTANVAEFVAAQQPTRVSDRKRLARSVEVRQVRRRRSPDRTSGAGAGAGAGAGSDYMMDVAESKDDDVEYDDLPAYIKDENVTGEKRKLDQYDPREGGGPRKR